MGIGQILWKCSFSPVVWSFCSCAVRAAGVEGNCWLPCIITSSADMAARMQTLYHGHSEDNHKKKLKCHISDQIKASRHEGLGDRHQRQMFWLWLPVCSCERSQWRNQVKMLLMSRSVSSHASQYLQRSTSSVISVTLQPEGKRGKIVWDSSKTLLSLHCFSHLWLLGNERLRMFNITTYT